MVSISPDTGAPLPRWRVVPDDEALRRLDVPRSTVFRLLMTLEGLGYVSSNGRQFSLTPRILDLGFAYRFDLF